MIEFAKHISLLLRTHDCVIIPGFGGILAYPIEASYDEQEHIFRAPERRMGFNVRLKHNDGVLVQSYMSAHHLTAEEAMTRIQKVVVSMQKQLQTTGRVALRGIGDFSSNIKDEIVFTPYYNYILTPSYYGLENFAIAPLSTPSLVEFVPRSASSHKSVSGFAVAAIVALTVLFTSILPGDDDNKVGRASSSAFAAMNAEQTRNQQHRRDYTPRKVSEVKASDIVATQVATDSTDAPTPSVPASAGVSKSRQAEREAKAAPSASQSVGSTSISKRKSYYVIAASLPTLASAEPYLSDYKARGFREATIVEGNSRYRIAIAQFDNRQSAESKISDLRKDAKYKDVWLLIQ